MVVETSSLCFKFTGTHSDLGLSKSKFRLKTDVKDIITEFGHMNLTDDRFKVEKGRYQMIWTV